MGMQLNRCLRVKFPSRVASKASSEGMECGVTR